MNTERLILYLKNIPAGKLALFTLIGATLVAFGVGESNEQVAIVGYIAYLLNHLIIAICCYFIVRAHKQSWWYVPLICNAMTIIAAFVEPNFWRGELWIASCSGWILTAAVTIAAILIGKREANRSIVEKM
jgi:hypothetical protein